LVAIDHEISPEPARIGPATMTLKLADLAAIVYTGQSAERPAVSDY
jgi:hypothetical protein